MRPARLRQSRTKIQEEVVAGAAGRARPRQADASQRVSVAATDERNRGRPSLLPRSGDIADELVVRPEHRTVTSLERRHEIEELQVDVEGNLTSVEVQQMVQREENVLLPQPRD